MINGFDYSRYLREKKIAGIVKLQNVVAIGNEKDLTFYLFKFKEKIFSIINKIYNNEEIGFLKAILLGETSSLDENIKESFKEANISHVLAISGLHISYVVLGLEGILKLFIKNIKIRNAIIIVFLVAFTIFVGESNSVCRACIMVSITYFGNIILKKDDFYASFRSALIFLLIINPYNIFSGSMWLSFGGSIGIVLYSKLIEKYIAKKIKLKKFSELDNKFLIFIYKILNKSIAIISVTLGAQIIVFPIMIYMFNTISLNFIISNLLISELVGPILIFGYLSLLFPFLSIFEKILIKIIFFFAKFSASLPITSFLISTPNLYKIIIYYAILFVIAFIYKTKRIFIFRQIKKQKLKIILIFSFVLILLFGNFNNIYKNDFEIHFLDVGQGDSCLVRTNTNKVILIDGGKGINGEYDYGQKVVGPYLLDHGITKIDYVVVSHFDSDHCGGLFYIIQNFKVKNIIIGKQAEEYPNLIKFLQIQRKRKINLISLTSENVLYFDKKTKIEVLFPNLGHEVSENKINNNSLVFKMYYDDISILFTGDIEEEAEKVLVELYSEKLNSNILKVGHHGSKTSSTEEFINCVKPEISLIGVGKNNNFGHPNGDVLDRLQNYGSKVYRTDKDGEIILKVNSKGKIKIKKIIDS